jgi:hypothetical protein
MLWLLSNIRQLFSKLLVTLVGAMRKNPTLSNNKNAQFIWSKVVWLDGDRTSNICILPSFLGCAPTHSHGISTTESTFASNKKLTKFSQITFFVKKQKSEKVFSRLTLGNCEFAECEIWQLH